MTVLDASNKLFDWFSDNDSFCVEEDFQKLILISESKERDISAIKLALEQLSSAELIKRNENHWILARPFEKWEQSVTVNPPVADLIAKTVNDFCDVIDDQTDRCEASSIGEKDIRNVLIITDHYKSLVLQNINTDEK
tara:strand:+ start:3323 stop:3736 length:414 start_codon:yes stop_codon:yes gene_type:complete